MPDSSAGPEATIAPRLIDAPSSTTAISSSVLALNEMPALPDFAGLPQTADGDAEKNRDHQRLDIGMAESRLLPILQDHRDRGDENAEHQARHDGGELGRRCGEMVPPTGWTGRRTVTHGLWFLTVFHRWLLRSAREFYVLYKTWIPAGVQREIGRLGKRCSGAMAP